MVEDEEARWVKDDLVYFTKLTQHVFWLESDFTKKYTYGPKEPLSDTSYP